jgi:thiol-disulfide isomerase/thioredoxin
MTKRGRHAGRRLPATIALSIALAACGGAGGGPSAAGTMVPATPSVAPATVPASTPTAGSTEPPTPAANPVAEVLAAHPWAAATLTDVTTGEPFTIASLAGRTIFVEAMAIWCTNCRAQQGRFTEALASLDPETVAYVVLTVDPAETADDLARYKAQRGFTGRYAVAGREVAAALQAEFGANVLNPPSVPLVLISPSGDISFRTGGESVDGIIAAAGA